MFQKASMLRQFSNSCLDLEELGGEEEAEILEQLSPRSRGKRIIALSADREEPFPMPPTPPGRGRTELAKTFSGSCLELDDLMGDSPSVGVPQGPGGRCSPLYQFNDTRQIIDYVHTQNSRRRAIDKHRDTSILVTGAGAPGSGYLATHIIARLLHEGYEVRATIRDASLSERLIEDTKSSSRASLEVFPGSDPQTGSPDLLYQALLDVDSVIHCPSSGGGVMGPRDGVRNIFKAVKATGNKVRKIVMASTVLMVNQEGVEGPLDETNWNNVTKEEDPAAWARVEAEKEAWALSQETKTPLTAIISSTVVGPSMGGEVSESMRVVRDLIYAPSYFPFAPQISRNLVNIEDVASAHCRALGTDAANNQRFLVTGGSYTLSEIGQVIKRKFPQYPVPTRDAWNWITLLVVPTVNTQITRASLRQQLGYGKAYNTSKVRQVLKISIQNPDNAILETVEDLLSRGELQEPTGTTPATLPLCLLATLGLGSVLAWRRFRS
eukprot:TRINITY_DN1045_c0_g1_i1.p1 TRINITY_DN1045_c0_g1~~TRINITY_DN1045_c0_g1_i1.p1  ORF type:complete len:521 (+),score=71.83 TRINITY_DN1045_c0_g1_i1:81-1565(+)